MTTFRRATIAAALIATPATAVAWLLTGRPGFSLAAAGWCVLSATLELAYLWLLATAYRRGELSVVYPIARGSAPLLAVIAGLGLLHERLTGVQLAGVGLLLLGILAVTVPQTSGRATVPALLTGVAIASYTAIDRVGVRLSTPWLYGWLLVVLLAVAIPVSMWVAARLARVRPDFERRGADRAGAADSFAGGADRDFSLGRLSARAVGSESRSSFCSRAGARNVCRRRGRLGSVEAPRKAKPRP